MYKEISGEALDKKVIRYSIIHRYLQLNGCVKLTRIHRHLEKEMGREYCRAQIYHDLTAMIENFNAPIEFDGVGWEYVRPYEFWKEVLLKVSDHVELPTEINKIIFK